MVPTGNHIQWLKNKLKNAEERFISASEILDKIRRERNKSEHEVSTWRHALNLALQETGKTQETEEVHISEKPERTSGTIPDTAAAILKERGPLKTDELAELVNERRGKVSSNNSIFTGLNRYRPDRFDRKGGRWYLAESNGNAH